MHTDTFFFIIAGMSGFWAGFLVRRIYDITTGKTVIINNIVPAGGDINGKNLNGRKNKTA